MSRYIALIALMGLGADLAAQSLGIPELPPMKWVEQVTPEDLPELKYPEYANVIDRVRTQINTGRYRLALQTLALSDQAKTPVAITLRAKVLLAMGQFSEALPLLQSLVPDEQTVSLVAEATAMAGQRREAAEQLTKAIEKYPESAFLRMQLAEVQESMGQLSAARKTLNWFAEQDYLTKWREGELRDLDDAQKLVTIARALDRLAILTGQYRTDLNLHNDVLLMFTRAYDVLDRRSVEAHVRAAEFYWAHDNEGAAKDELGQALQINPNHLGAITLMGEMSVDSYDFDGCERAIGMIQAVNPQHSAASLLTAQLLLTQNLPDEALAYVEGLVKADPDNALYAAHLAACTALKFDRAALDARLSELDARMPESSLAYDVAGQYLLNAFQFKDAARLLQVAVERTPHWNSPRNRLALAYMQQTDTEKAKPILEEARRLDPFNIQTTNYLRLLDSILEFKLAKSDHFAVRYSATDDPFLADEMLQYMEKNYARITSQFAYEPDERTVIELMPTSQDFAVRTVGKPWIGTVGASAGSLITMVAPRGIGKTNGPFDWCDVTRHEFVHTVTLGATNHRIPRWFTEGLAVSEQTKPLPYPQAQVACQRRCQQLPLHHSPDQLGIHPSAQSQRSAASLCSVVLAVSIYQAEVRTRCDPEDDPPVPRWAQD